MVRDSFTVYNKETESGDVIENDTTIIDNMGSIERNYISIFELFDKEKNDVTRTLVGQLITKNQYIRKGNTFEMSIRYVLGTDNFFFKNGSINVEYNTFNWLPGETVIGTITYGTGEYLGITGFCEFVNLDYKYDDCKNVSLWYTKATFYFTN